MHTPTTHAPARQPAPSINWGERASCRGMDLDPFFSSDLDDQQEALRTCQDCPVRMDCLLQALAVEEEHGVWGGMLESDRRSMIKQRRANREAAQAPLVAASRQPRPLVMSTQRAVPQATSLAA